jgi:hypothetical protein
MKQNVALKEKKNIIVQICEEFSKIGSAGENN